MRTGKTILWSMGHDMMVLPVQALVVQTEIMTAGFRSLNSRKAD